MAEDSAKEPGPKTLSMFSESRPGSIRTLRESYRAILKLPEPSDYITEVVGESDRASVVLASAMLDDMLKYSIATSLKLGLTEKQAQHVFRNEGPLGSFSSRIEIGCLFGVIEDATYQQLNIIREMRNACAHSKHKVSFADPVLRNVAVRLFEPLGFTPLSFAEKQPKLAFSLEVAFLIQVLISGSRKEGKAESQQTFREMLKLAPDKRS